MSGERFARVFPAFSEDEMRRIGRSQAWLVLLGEKEVYCSEDDSKEIADERAKVINAAHSQAVREAVKAFAEKAAKIASEAFEAGGYESAESVDLGNDIAAQIRKLAEEA